ncbi:ABC transporter ATP-binding protein [Parahaliea mediterranea]|uniref:ABC transporter ATP-binding protein n=1 Tax=Parahaliea mediterranea TaxID=651086 RepID=A0A939DFN7_9GAMM|nr:ABC transporter ATP-binding protein [Parahaliea mediterranea]MBN7796672.1 ABC transporter ATP-binding protein [Parahaliea mediterranea]
MTSQLLLQDVSVAYGDFTAVAGISLSLEQGQIGCLLGPSGCGKTTLLRAIAGFEPVSAGDIVLGGQVISAPGILLPPERRRVGMVFQDFALFPHLDVRRNIGFGLAALERTERRARVDDMLALVGLGDYAGAYPHELSGGQQQRVALARALAPGPDILLLDEPFSSLDTELREQLAGEVRELLKRNGVTAILVTHDQHEAFAMADQIALLRGGRLAQVDTPYNLYHNPATEFVAEFIGQGSIIEVSVNEAGELNDGLGALDMVHRDWRAGERLRLLVRPDDIEYDELSQLHLPVTNRAFRGANYLYELRLPDGQRVPCLTPSHVDTAPGLSLPVRFNLQHVVVFKSGVETSGVETSGVETSGAGTSSGEPPVPENPTA